MSSTLKFPQIRLTDSASTQKKPLAQKDLYRLYVCGITPYDATHLGHAATYLSFDLIHRYLVASGSTVNYVQNITDIDEPLLERANRDGVEWENLASEQIELFRKDMSALNVLPPTHYIGAIEAIPLVVEAIENLSEKKSTYEIDKDVYFSVKHDSNFANISHLKDQEMIEIFSQRGGDPTLTGKKDPLDCLVWMLQRPNEPGWNSSYGFGRPGWHIECTAIALNYLAPDLALETLIDIQGGGSDLIFPHHEMSAAQGRAMNGKEFAENYVHAGMIGLGGEKMSKSKGNLIFVSQLLKDGVDPMAIRIALMSHHYRKDHMWQSEDLISAQEFLENLRIALSRMEVAPTDHVIKDIVSALSQDIDTPAALNVLKNWIEATSKGETGGHPGELSRAIDALLGIAI
jgi:L-cysteine:1D-myo-inositol 2-amino-2-deoxy-alpha-D-glucopyranoside ligase